MDDLSKLKQLLSIDDDERNELLQLIIDNTKARLKVKLHKNSDDADIPKGLNYILIEVSIKRFNRLKNEGMSNYSQEGESFTFSDDDFEEFEDDIKDWMSDQEDKPTSHGRVKFVSGYN